MSEPWAACRRARPLLAELALGALEGRTRGELLGHLERCSACAREADGLAATADLLCELAPAAPAPRGLDRAVLAAGRSGRSRRRRRVERRALVGLSAAALVAAGLLVGHLAFAGSGQRHLLAVGQPVAGSAWAGAARSATLTSQLHSPSGARIGTVAVRAGPNAALVVHLAHPLDQVVAPVVECVAETRDGRRLDLGSYAAGMSSWSAPLPVAADTLASARLMTPSGAVLAVASLSW
jgi:hypothetical protein